MIVMQPEKVDGKTYIHLTKEEKSSYFFKGKKVYIAGGITGIPDYKQRFAKVERELQQLGAATMNPAILPETFTWEDCMHICQSMIDVCDMIVFLPEWTKSKGSKKEHEYGCRNCKTMVTGFCTVVRKDEAV